MANPSFLLDFLGKIPGFRPSQPSATSIIDRLQEILSENHRLQVQNSSLKQKLNQDLPIQPSISQSFKNPFQQSSSQIQQDLDFLSQPPNFLSNLIQENEKTLEYFQQKLFLFLQNQSLYQELKTATDPQAKISLALTQSKLIQQIISHQKLTKIQILKKILIASQNTAMGIARQTNQFEELVQLVNQRIKITQHPFTAQTIDQYYRLLLELEQFKQGVQSESVLCQQGLSEAILEAQRILGQIQYRPEIENKEQNIQGLLKVFRQLSQQLIEKVQQTQVEKELVEKQMIKTETAIRKSNEKLLQACCNLVKTSQQSSVVNLGEQLSGLTEIQKQLSQRLLKYSIQPHKSFIEKPTLDLIKNLTENSLQQVEYLIQKLKIKDQAVFQIQNDLKINFSNLFLNMKELMSKTIPDHNLSQQIHSKAKILFQELADFNIKIIKRVPHLSSAVFNSLRQASNANQNFLRLLLTRHKGNKDFYKQYQELITGKLKIKTLLAEIQQAEGLQGKVQTAKALVSFTSDWIVSCQALKTKMLKTDPSGSILPQQSLLKLDQAISSIRPSNNQISTLISNNRKLDDKILAAANIIQGLSASQVEQLEVFDQLINQIQHSVGHMGSQNRNKGMQELIQNLSQLRNHPNRIKESIEEISRFFQTIFSSDRQLRRAQTTVGQRPLLLRYNSVHPNEISHNQSWVTVLKSLEVLLIQAYQKLIIYNPELKNLIEPVIQQNQGLIERIRSAEQTQICEIVQIEVKLVEKIVENAYSLNDITKNLSEIKDQQINLQKKSQEFLSKMKSTLQLEKVKRSSGRRRTYLNVIYAEPEEDNQPIKTILNLIEDIKNNQDILISLEQSKENIFDKQEKAQQLVSKMEKVFSSDNKWEKILAVQQIQPFGTICARIQYIMDNFEQFVSQENTLNQEIVKKLQKTAVILQEFGKAGTAQTMQQNFKGLNKRFEKIANIEGDDRKIYQIASLLQDQVYLLQSSVRTFNRSRTTQPQRSLRISYDTRFSPNQNDIWVPLYKKLDKLLVSSYQKLIGFNPLIRDSIEPQLKNNKQILKDISKYDTLSISSSLLQQIKLFKLVLKNAYSLQDITKSLQEIETKQVQLQKQLQSLFSFLSSVLNQPQISRKNVKRDTYLNVIYAEPSQDNRPIQTVLKLLNDLNDNQEILFDLVQRNNQVFLKQERARFLVNRLNNSLDKHDQFIQIVQIQNSNPLISLFQKLQQLANHFDESQQDYQNQILKDDHQDILDLQQAVDLLSNLTFSIQAFCRSSIPAESRSQLQTLFTRFTNIQQSPNSLQKIILIITLLQQHVNIFHQQTRTSRRSMTQTVSSPLLSVKVPQQTLASTLQNHPILQSFQNLIRESCSKLEITDTSLQLQFETQQQEINKVNHPINQQKLNELIQKYLQIMTKVIDSAFTMSNITKNLQEIADKQVELEKVSEFVSNRIKNIFNLPQNRDNRRASTYVTVTYAQAAEDKQPIHTLLQLVQDIQSNLDKLVTFEQRKLQCLDTQQLPRQVLLDLKSLSSEQKFIGTEEPILALFRKLKELPSGCFEQGVSEVQIQSLDFIISKTSELYTALTGQKVEIPETEDLSSRIQHLEQVVCMTTDYFVNDLKSQLDSSKIQQKFLQKLAKILVLTTEITVFIDPNNELSKQTDSILSSSTENYQLIQVLKCLKTHISFISTYFQSQQLEGNQEILNRQNLEEMTKNLQKSLSELEHQNQAIAQENQEVREALEKVNQ